MRIILLISIVFLLFGCEKEQPISGGKSTEVYVNPNSMLRTTHCLLQYLDGDPTNGGCWQLISVPSGSTITQSDLGDSDNPCIEFDGQPCPADYVFQYQACCGDTTCVSPADLTICLTCFPPVCNVLITATCN